MAKRTEERPADLTVHSKFGPQEHEKRTRKSRRAAYTDRRRSKLRALVLVPVIRETGNGRPALPSEERLEEAVGLARAIDLEIAHSGVVRMSRPRPATFFGPGKVEDLRNLVDTEHAGLVIVDHPLTPVQQRNLERTWKAKILDRTGLILEIFGARARTKEGRLQVELAHLLYQRSRLVRSWTHLERQRGGYGFLGGPGETQIEADRRIIGERIDAIRRDLAAVRRTRELHRESRRRTPFPIVALAGYTNAGKSSLFNALTSAKVAAEDQVFATLDPTMRKLELPFGTAILSDTVGFISDLPTTLVAAFRATLEEVSHADLILHVRDVAASASDQQKKDVESVLAGLDVDVHAHDSKIIEVWNKIDLLTDEQRQAIEAKASRQERSPVLISAATGEGLDELKAAINERLSQGHVVRCFTLDASQGALVNWLYEHGDIQSRADDPSGAVTLEARLAQTDLKRFEHMMAKQGRGDTRGTSATH